ncbi:MAG: hypothetical protein IPM13_16820 [Phycisphaerales bacterium]|nr:hypothetical protein [Phycisphaerales bacterium]
MIARSRGTRRDVLVERGRSWRADGTPVRNYTCGLGRLAARVCGDQVVLRRKFGVMCPGLDLTLAELAQLVSFLRWWEEHRTGWSAFYWTGAGHPPGWGAETAFYQARGTTAPVRVAIRDMGGTKGADFTGRDVRVRIAPPQRVADVADHVARLIRRGERFGDPAGEEVGGIFRCGELRVEARRGSVEVKRGRHWISLEPAERQFLERLLAVEAL